MKEKIKEEKEQTHTPTAMHHIRNFDEVVKETAKLVSPIIKNMDRTMWLIGKTLYEAKQQTPRGQKGEVMRLVWKNVRDETELSRQDLKKCLDYYESNLGLYK